MARCQEVSSVMAVIPFKGFLRFIQTRFLRTSATPLSSSSLLQSSFTVQYLTSCCGIPLETALSISQKVRLNENKSPKYDSVSGFLKSYGFSSTEFVQLVTNHPAILASNVLWNLKPKFEYLVDCGFVGSLLPTLILSYPQMLQLSLKSHIKPLIGILVKYLDTNEKVIKAFSRCSISWSVSKMQRNVDFLLSESVPFESIGKLLLMQPSVIISNSDRMVFAVNAMKKVGMLPHSRMFLYALASILSMNESNFKMKLEFFKSLGWTEEDISFGMMRYPGFLKYSVEKVRGAMDFYINTMKVDLEFVIRHPVLLSYSINKRILPRYNILKYLESKELIKLNKGFLNVVVFMSRETFTLNYMSKYEDEVPNLMRFYKTNN